MEVTLGYQRTAVRVTPADWGVKRLRDVITLIPAGIYGEEKPRNGLIPFPVATTAHISADDTWNTKEMNVRYFTRPQLERYSPVEGDLIVVKSSGSAAKIQSGKVGFIDRENAGRFLFSNFLMLLRPTAIEPRFLYSYLSSHNVKKLLPSLVEASTYPNIRIGEYLDVEIRNPPRPEQEAIAEVLNDADARVESRELLIAKKHLIKRGVAQQLLTGKKRMPGFIDDWEVKQLGELAVLSKAAINPASTPDALFTHFSLPAFDAGAVPASEEGRSIGSSKFLVPPNAVLLSKLNPRIPRMWAPSHIPNNAVCSTEFLVLLPKTSTDRNYLAAVCSSPAVCSQMEHHAIGTTGSHQRVRPSQALAIEINTPRDKAEQTAIAAILSDLDAEIAALGAQLTKDRQLNQGIVQELLTGRIRLG